MGRGFDVSKEELLDTFIRVRLYNLGVRVILSQIGLVLVISLQCCYVSFGPLEGRMAEEIVGLEFIKGPHDTTL